MKACPYRATLHEKLGSPPEKVNEQLDAWLASLGDVVQRMETYYASGNYAKGL